jgi:hypothetical protein
MNKLKSLTLNQAVLLRDALELIEPDSRKSQVDKYYLLAQLETIIERSSIDEVAS